MTMSHGAAPPTGPEPLSGGTALGPAAADPARVLAVLGRSWTWIMGAAIATLVPGVLVLVWPDETLHVLAVLIGLYLLVTGAFRFVSSFSREEHGERFAGLLLAVLYVLAGVLCLRNPPGPHWGRRPGAGCSGCSSGWPSCWSRHRCARASA